MAVYCPLCGDLLFFDFYTAAQCIPLAAAADISAFPRINNILPYKISETVP